MKKYLLICLAFMSFTFFLAIFNFGIEPLFEYWIIIPIFCAPFIIVTGIVIGISYALKRNINGKNQIFHKSFRNTQLILCSAYLIFLLWITAGNINRRNEPERTSPVFSEADLKWYLNTKNQILIQSDLKYDSLYVSYNNDSTYITNLYFNNAHLFLKTGIATTKRLEIHYSKNGDFELRREICEKGNYGFEGIFYKEKSYGLSTWWYCTGKIEEQGIRYMGEQIGPWDKWDKQNEHIIIVNHALDTPYEMPKIQDE